MFKEIGDLKVHYEVSGEGGPVILLHGGQMRLKSWEHIAPLLAKEFKVYRYDVRGHGETVRPPGPQPTHEEWVDDLYRFIESFDLKAPAVAGWSMGASIGLNFAVKYPGVMSQLILVGSASPLIPLRGRELWVERRRLKESGASGEEIMEKTFGVTKGIFSPQAENNALEMVREQLLAHFSMPLEQISIPQGDLPDIGSKLGGIQCPTLCIVGDGDSRTPIEASESLNKEIPNSYMKIIPNCGHAYGYEQPELTARAMNTFLKAFK